MYENQEETAAPFSPSSGTGGILTLGGVLSKAADTALDVWGIRETGKVIGSVYPTGQVNPAAVPAITGNTAAQKPPFNYMPLVYIGAGVAALLIVTVALRK